MKYGAVFTFGKSKFADNIPSQFFIRNDPITEISCGDQHTVVVCEFGRVYAFGSNEWGQLGLGHQEPVNRPTCIKKLKPEKVKHVACGWAHTLFTTENGKVYSCGCNTNGQLGVGDNKTIEHVAFPVYVTELDEEIMQIAAGSQHSVLLTSSGILYVWGSNSSGQLGLLKSEMEVYPQPTLLSIPYNVSSISCGYYHTGFVTIDGKLLLCGNGENGELGIDEKSHGIGWTPTEANITANIISVACGGRHSIALTSSDGCYVCGNNSAGQLGLENVSSTSTWTHLHFEDSICEVSAGENHSMFLTDTGAVYACGDTKYGKLCISDCDQTVRKPCKIDFPFSTLKVTKLVCGGCHTIILAFPSSATSQPYLIRDVQLGKSLHDDRLDFPQRESRTEYNWDYEIDRRSLDYVSDRNSPNLDSTKSLKSDDSDKRTNYENNEISNPENKMEKVIHHLDEIKKETDTMNQKTTENDNTNKKLYFSEKSATEGKFRKILRHFGVQKTTESKHENSNIHASYLKSTTNNSEKDLKSNHNCYSNHVTSKVCLIL